MQRYPVRASQRKVLTPDGLRSLVAAHFENVEPDGAAVLASFGAVTRLRTWVDGRDLAVDVTMNPKVPEAIAAETIRRYNQFLEAATGFSAKERAKRLRKSATGSGD
jgi:hypothetical protein